MTLNSRALARSYLGVLALALWCLLGVVSPHMAMDPAGLDIDHTGTALSQLPYGLRPADLWYGPAPATTLLRSWQGHDPEVGPLTLTLGYRHDPFVCYRDAGFGVVELPRFAVSTAIVAGGDEVDPLGCERLRLTQGEQETDVATWFFAQITGRPLGTTTGGDRLRRLGHRLNALLQGHLDHDLLQAKVAFGPHRPGAGPSDAAQARVVGLLMTTIASAAVR